MIGGFDLSMVNWARAQFALTALYHWIFVPLTLGLSLLCAFYESIYIKTGNEEWLRLTKFWMKLFGINFAIGVATGIILEFEFGTNWANYSWMVGDIFGAPLAIEGIAAFFLETTFFAVMFFGWDRVSKRFHLTATWLVAIGSNLSAVWILVANAWMQHPVGMAFNLDKARFEMHNFWDIILSPIAVSKFTHTTSSSFVVASLFVISISSYFLLQKRHLKMAKRSIIVAAVFGLLASLFVGFTGDEAAFEVAQYQPMKLAAFEGLYQGEKGAGLAAAGIVNLSKKVDNDEPPFDFVVRIPGLLSILANRKPDTFVPGINDLVNGNPGEGIMGAAEKIARGRFAIRQLSIYKQAVKTNHPMAASQARVTFNRYKKYLGYGFLSQPKDTVPNVAVSFYSFHLMVFLGTIFIAVFLAFLFFTLRGNIDKQRWLLLPGTIMFVLSIICSQAGWVAAEAGRQPWAIQGLLPVTVARTNLTSGTVQITFFMFLFLFTALLIADLKIMSKQIKLGPEDK
ncbi:MAG: cytochrome ubiquinol oxidase subunit I [Deltaproteobacteria bacterium]|nr:cytochrome ubiquinol oxidase subunit I [Deltaproteobacteria bacterium]